MDSRFSSAAMDSTRRRTAGLTKKGTSFFRAAKASSFQSIEVCRLPPDLIDSRQPNVSNLVLETSSQWLDTLTIEVLMPMDPFFGVPMPTTPPAEVRACMATQLGQDVFLSRGGPLDNVTPPGREISQEELNIAHRFCTTLE